MKSILVSIPVLGLALILQTSIVGRMTLLSGSADLILLVLAAWSLQERVRNAGYWAVTATVLVGVISGVPWYVYLIGFLVTVVLGRMLTRRVWQAPLLAMFFVTLIGTMVLHMTTFIVLSLSLVPLPFGDSLAKVVLPSILLNLLLAIPVHSLLRDLASRLYPSEVGA